MIHNEIIELNGERAKGSAYFEFTGVNNEKSFVGGRYYEHDFVKVNGKWKFKKLKAVIHYMVPLAEGWASGAGFSGIKSL
ncbi:MAG: nuclear transport factor 2 family protein [Deltaproteobacteria bacterium]|nr:nuclear transport factor 2 family protein [Deltaproteobacteria bacterium]